jgi:hypothetical protein
MTVHYYITVWLIFLFDSELKFVLTKEEALRFVVAA